MKTHNFRLVIAAVVCLLTIWVPAIETRGQKPAGGSHESGEGGEEGPSADIGVLKTSTQEQVSPGADLTYTITVTNSSTDPAENATMNDVLPATLTFVSIDTPAGWSCSTPMVGAEGTVTCTNPSLAFTEGDVFTLVVHVPANAEAGTFISNTATVSTTTLDPNDENNSSTLATLVAGNSADISVTKSADSDEVSIERPITYTITVINTGPDQADNATMIDVLPAEVYFLSLSQPAGWMCTTPTPGSGGTVSCSRETLPVTTGDVFTLTVAVRADTNPDTVIINTATVDTSTPEPSDENNSASAFTLAIARDPTAADGSITGKILDSSGHPIAGVTVMLSGAQSRRTITDASGSYRFDRVETNGLYTATPVRANFNFNPLNRSFSLIGNNTEAAFTGISTGDHVNPLDTPEYFVRQQYVDILNREPDEAGFNYWSDQLLGCGADAACMRSRRTSVAAAFFIENEFRQSGAFIYDVYASALGRRPVYNEYTIDRAQVIGGPTLVAQKRVFAEAFVTRAEFMTRFANNPSGDSFVDALLANAQAVGIDLSSQRDSLINRYHTGASQNESRALVLRDVSETAAVRDHHANAAFVETEYFGYLHRNPDAQGRTFWLNVLNNGDPGNYRGMVCSFVTSTEYQHRFSSVASHSNSECGQ